MRIGFHLNYTQSDNALAGLALASQISRAGHDISILSRGTRSRSVDPHFDNKVINHKSISFWDWAQKQDIIIWTHAVPVEVIQVLKQLEIKTVIYSLWDELSKDVKLAYRVVDMVASPIMQNAIQLREMWKIKKSYYWPLNLNLPITLKEDITNKDLKVLVPICGSQIYVQYSEVFDMLNRIIKNTKNTKFTLLTSKRFAAFANKAVEQLQKENEVTVIKDPDWIEQVKLYSNHDLVVKCSVRDNCNLIPLVSAALGTPLITLDLPPINETPGSKHMFLSECMKTSNEFKVPLARPDYNSFTSEVIELCENREKINKAHVDLSKEFKHYHKLSKDGLTMTIED